MIAGMFIGYKLFWAMNPNNSGSAAGGSSDLLRSLRPSQVQQVLNLIEMRYVDSLPQDSLEINAIEALMARLDPHSQFIPAQQMDEVSADLRGNFGGVGIEYMIINDTVVAVSVIEKGPAAEAGVAEGDALLAVNGKNISGTNVTHDQLRSLLRGEANSKLTLTLLRNDQKIDKTLKRGIIPLPSVDAWYMINATAGYIKINRFSETTFFEFMDAATGLTKAGMQQLILDLRGNGGGLLDQATKIADELLKDGTTIVKVKGSKMAEEITYSTKPGIFEEGAIVVLVDENSASASEVLAAALQENDRATIIGRRTFGKGLVQEQYILGNQGALRLTVARYLTPLGRSIQKPYTSNKAAYHHEVYERRLNPTADEDTAGKKAFVTRKGKRVYEVGGVVPDSTVLPDTTATYRQLARFAAGNKFMELSYKYFHQHKQSIATLGSAQAFVNNYKLSNADWQLVENALQNDSLPGKIQLRDTDRLWLEHRLKANVARYIWRAKGYYEVLNLQDKMVQTGLQILNTKPTP